MKYSKKIAERICEALSTGDTRIVDVCAQVGISKDTFYEWKKTKSDFSDSLKKAEDARMESFRQMARTGLASRLVEREVEEVHTEYVDKNGKPTIKSRKVVKRLILPSDLLIMFTLKNTDAENFKDKQEITGKDGAPLATTAIIQIVPAGPPLASSEKEVDEDV